MHLIIFDIDGTLTETMKIDEECFVRSFKEVFGFADIDTDWSHYPHTTDSSIFHEFYVSRRGRPSDCAGCFAISSALCRVACCRLIAVSICTSFWG